MLSIFPFYSVTPNNFINRVVVCFNLVEKRVGELFEIYRNSLQKSPSRNSMIESFMKDTLCRAWQYRSKVWINQKKTPFFLLSSRY